MEGKKVEEYALKSSNISYFDDTKTNYTIVGITNVDVPKIRNSAEFNVLLEKLGAFAYFATDTDSSLYVNTWRMYSTGIIIKIPKGVYVDLVAAQTGLTDTLVQYEMVQPELINLTEQGLVEDSWKPSKTVRCIVILIPSIAIV